MSRSMWCCSGKHWLGQAAVWSVFAAGVAFAAGPETAGPQDISIKIAPLIATGGVVSIKFKHLNLAELCAEAFGDHDTTPAGR